MSKVNVTLTRPQIDALLFACSNALAEPANFEPGTGNERLFGPLDRAHAKLAAALDDDEKTTRARKPAITPRADLAAVVSITGEKDP